jgi:hypothetical protein
VSEGENRWVADAEAALAALEALEVLRSEWVQGVNWERVRELVHQNLEREFDLKAPALPPMDRRRFHDWADGQVDRWSYRPWPAGDAGPPQPSMGLTMDGWIAAAKAALTDAGVQAQPGPGDWVGAALRRKLVSERACLWYYENVYLDAAAPRAIQAAERIRVIERMLRDRPAGDRPAEDA